MLGCARFPVRPDAAISGYSPHTWLRTLVARAAGRAPRCERAPGRAGPAVTYAKSQRPCCKRRRSQRQHRLRGRWPSDLAYLPRALRARAHIVLLGPQVCHLSSGICKGGPGTQIHGGEPPRHEPTSLFSKAKCAAREFILPQHVTHAARATKYRTQARHGSRAPSRH